MHVHEIERRREDERAAATKSAGPSPHALLALQRSAGNQAVARTILKKRVAPLIMAGMTKPKPDDKDELLLKVYNSLRSELEEPPAPFTKVEDATAALIKGKVIDADDVRLLDAAADKKFGGKMTGAKKLAAGSEEALLANIRLDRPDVERKYRHHIFEGDFDEKDVPTGYHSKKGGSKTHVAYGPKSDVANTVGGIYQQSVKAVGTGTKKGTQSTFFPDSASEDDILNAIASVYGARSKYTTVQHPTTLKGMTLAKLGDATAFPSGGRALGPSEDEEDGS